MILCPIEQTHLSYPLRAPLRGRCPWSNTWSWRRTNSPLRRPDIRGKRTLCRVSRNSRRKRLRCSNRCRWPCPIRCRKCTRRRWNPAKRLAALRDKALTSRKSNLQSSQVGNVKRKWYGRTFLCSFEKIPTAPWSQRWCFFIIKTL